MRSGRNRGAALAVVAVAAFGLAHPQHDQADAHRKPLQKHVQIPEAAKRAGESPDPPPRVREPLVAVPERLDERQRGAQATGRHPDLVQRLNAPGRSERGRVHVHGIKQPPEDRTGMLDRGDGGAGVHVLSEPPAAPQRNGSRARQFTTPSCRALP